MGRARISQRLADNLNLRLPMGSQALVPSLTKDVPMMLRVTQASATIALSACHDDDRSKDRLLPQGPAELSGWRRDTQCAVS